MRFVFGDVETSGLGANAGVVEICWIETDGDFNEVARHHSLINPGCLIEFGAMSVHGITNEMVADKPTLDEFMASLGNPLRGGDTALVAHSSPFDIRFFGPHMDKQHTICTLRCSRVLYPEADNHKLGTLRYMLGLYGDHAKAHSADEDVEVLLQLAKRMCADAGCTLADLAQIQNIPRKIDKMPFGKWKGVKLPDLPADYVRWLLEKANIDDDLRASLMAL